MLAEAAFEVVACLQTATFRQSLELVNCGIRVPHIYRAPYKDLRVHPQVFGRSEKVISLN